MNKFVLSAVAACALGFAGMSYAADLPEGWEAKDAGNGVTVIPKVDNNASRNGRRGGFGLRSETG